MNTIENNSDVDRRDKKTILERHFGSIMSLLILASILWVVDSTYKQAISQTELMGSLKALDIRVDNLKELLAIAGDDRYKGRDATADRELLNLRLKAERERINSKFINIYERFEYCSERISHLELMFDNEN